MRPPVAVDSSVLVTIFNREPEARHFLRILSEVLPLIGAPTLLEARIWCLRRFDRPNLNWLSSFAEAAETVPFDHQLEEIAASAYARFGKGLHAAGLNYGDVMAYAVAVGRNAPLLFKGGDFSKTDADIHPASVIIA